MVRGVVRQIDVSKDCQWCRTSIVRFGKRFFDHTNGEFLCGRIFAPFVESSRMWAVYASSGLQRIFRNGQETRLRAPSRKVENGSDRVALDSTRRALLFAGVSGCHLNWLNDGGLRMSARADELTGESLVEDLQLRAQQAFAERDFDSAERLIDQLIDLQPANLVWREARGDILTDKKDFLGALRDFNSALDLVAKVDPETPGSISAGEVLGLQNGDARNPADVARLLAGRALVKEGLSDWPGALDDYNAALGLAKELGFKPDPYVVNSVGNCNASLGRYTDARIKYLEAANLFQGAKGFRGRNGSTTQRLDGAIYASTNAALMLAQIGDRRRALAELEAIARRGPGSVDARAALAALYWADERAELAEDVWEFACDKINEGCGKYRDKKWLAVVRRWPPVMIDLLDDFLNLRKA